MGKGAEKITKFLDFFFICYVCCMEWISIIQVIIAILLSVSILLQNRGSGLGSAFGGGGSASYYAKRGMEKLLVRSATVLAVLFVIVSIANVALGV